MNRPENARVRIAQTAGVTAAYAAVLVAVTWPAFVHASERILGGNFIFGHFHLIDLLEQALRGGHGIITETKELNFPAGGDMTFVGWTYIAPILAARFAGLPLVLAMNLLLAAHMLLGALGMNALARRLGVGRPESFAAGLFYGFSPFALSLLWNGQIEKISHGFLPLLLLVLMDAVSLRRWRPVAVFGVLFGVLLSTDPYNAIFAALLAAVTGVYVLVQTRRAKRAAVFGRLGAAALAALIASLPFLIYWHATQPEKEATALLMPAREDPQRVVGLRNSATLAGWVVPSVGRAGAVEASSWVVPSYHIHYLGWTVLLLAAVGWAGAARRAPPETHGGEDAFGLGFWLAVLAVFFVVAHGYFLELAPSTNWSARRLVPLPLAWLAAISPVFSTFSATYRAAVMVTLVLSVFAAKAMAALSLRWPRARPALVGATLSLFAAESVVLSPAPLPMPVESAKAPAVYADLGAVPDRGAVMELPNEAHVSDQGWNQRYLYYRALHHHPLAFRERAMPQTVNVNEEFLRFILEITSSDDGPSDLSAVDPRVTFCYLILHERFIAPKHRADLRAFLGAVFIPIKNYPNEGVRLYRTRSMGELGGLDVAWPKFGLDPALAATCPAGAKTTE